MQSLITRRCFLRDYSEEDREYYVRLNLDPEVRRYLNGPLTEEEANELFDQALNDSTPHQGFRWAVFARKRDEYIGHFFAVPWEAEGTMEWSLLLHRAFWSNGFATEIAAAALEYGLSLPKLERVIATVDEENAAGKRLLEKLGMGRFESCRDDHGVYHLYTIDNEGFRAHLPELKKGLWPNNRPSIRRKNIAAIRAELAMLEAKAE